MLEGGIEIVACPPGKEACSISLLSGGEKTLTCVALLLAVFRSKPSPFCILDEVDAALDEANIGRFIGVLRDFLSFTQFVVVTHSKKTMSGADTLYGVTMEESGVSKHVSVRFEDVSEDGHINLRTRRTLRRAARRDQAFCQHSLLAPAAIRPVPQNLFGAPANAGLSERSLRPPEAAQSALPAGLSKLSKVPTAASIETIYRMGRFPAARTTVRTTDGDRLAGGSLPTPSYQGRFAADRAPSGVPMRRQASPCTSSPGCSRV